MTETLEVAGCLAAAAALSVSFLASEPVCARRRWSWPAMRSPSR